LKILFVYPNVTRDKSPQLGICSLAGVARELGHECRLFDLTVIPRGEESSLFKSQMESYRPDLLAVSCRSNEWTFTAELFRSVDTGDTVTIFGGPHATVAPEEVIEIADVVVLGEGERTFEELLRGIESGKDISTTRGCWGEKDGQVVKNEMRDLIPDLDALPTPYWELFDDTHYRGSFVKERITDATVVGAFEGSRGCPFACTYCTNDYVRNLYKGKGKWRREKSPERIVEEVLLFREIYGLDFIYWVDEVMLTDLDRLKVFRDLYRAKVGVPFCFMERPENMTDEKVRVIKEAGAQVASIGIESGDEQLRMNLLNRRLSQEKIVSAFQASEKHGITTHAFTIIGYPDESDDSTMETFKLLKEARPDTVQTTIFYPLRKTKLFDIVVEKGLFDPDSPMPSRYYHGTSLDFSEAKKKELLRSQYLLSNFDKIGLRTFEIARRSKLAFVAVRMYALPREASLVLQTLRKEGARYTLSAIFRRIKEILD
jgi:radical SAM superfamily enzyme YgiQ (UPF0313 family)